MSCTYCALYKQGPPHVHCAAFPDGIPDRYTTGADPHAVPGPEQARPYVFTPRYDVSVVTLVARGELDAVLLTRDGATNPRAADV